MFVFTELFVHPRRVASGLVLSGRTVFGQSSAKDQQLDDHYFGSIPERARFFIKDFEREALRLGIPVTTRHNEVAPNQFECAPVFEEANLSSVAVKCEAEVPFPVGSKVAMLA